MNPDPDQVNRITAVPSRVEAPELATFDGVVAEVLADVEARRRRCGDELDPDRRAELGQYFTPSPLADFMANLFDVSAGPARLLDPGAGVGSLSAAVAARWQRDGGGPLELTAVEADSSLYAPLASTLADLTRVHDVAGEIVSADFVEWAVDRTAGFGALGAPRFDLVVMNPPYGKIHSSSRERQRLSAAGIEVPNLYAGFVALAAELLDDGGQLVAITPRSFTNGTYFRRFRRFLLERIGLRQIHVFDSRDVAFADSDVLQENVIFHGVRGERPTSVVVASSRSVGDPVTTREVPFHDVVRSDDPEAFLHIATDEASADFARQVLGLPCRLPAIDVQVSTGPVVDFRSKEHLRGEPAPGCVPLIYPAHLRGGCVVWPQIGGRKPNALQRNDVTAKLLMPAGNYVLVKRFTSKEERRRVAATVVSNADLPNNEFAFENHLNVFHCGGEGLSRSVALGLAAFLNTTTVDQFFRQFSGHTQVNATDLRNLRYPNIDQLMALAAATSPGMDQNELDEVASQVLPTFASAPLARTA